MVSVALFPSSFPATFLVHWPGRKRPKLAFLPPWLLGSGPTTQLKHHWTLCPNGWGRLPWRLRPQVCRCQWNLGRHLRNQENLEWLPSGIGRTQGHQKRPVHERTEEGLDQPLVTHQYSWIWFFVICDYSGGSWDTFQTRFVGLDECVMCNWEHERSVTLVTIWCAEFDSISKGCFHLV
jgi:hypothetical protein